MTVRTKHRKKNHNKPHKKHTRAKTTQTKKVKSEQTKANKIQTCKKSTKTTDRANTNTRLSKTHEQTAPKPATLTKPPKKSPRLATPHLLGKIAKHKLGLGLSALTLMALSVPATSLLAINSKMPMFEQISTKKTLVLATTKNDSTFFESGQLKHGFGYDLAQDYAHQLGAKVVIQHYADEQLAKTALLNGKADMALIGESTNTKGIKTTAVACQPTTQKAMAHHGVNAKLHFAFANDEYSVAHANEFLCNPQRQKYIANLAKFYSQSALTGKYNQQHFAKAVQKLPLYEYAFRQNAKTYNQDWRLLAMVAYQESHLKPDAISPTGVQGLMMLTKDTAREMGIKDRTDVFESIKGGAKYLSFLQGQFDDVSQADRLWFVLASYNMGPNAIKNIQTQVAKQGGNPNEWRSIHHYLMENQHQNSRYTQCLEYVSNIRTYLEAIHTV